MTNEIWLLRHGETEWSRSGQHTGRTDLPLTEVGQEQARKLRAALGGQQFDQVLTSPLRRARETAELAGFSGAVPNEDLMEWHYGDLEGRTSAEIGAEFPGWTIWTGPVPNGETLDQVAARADRVLSNLPSGRVAIFAHGHFLRVLATCWLGVKPDKGRLLSLSTASLSVLGWERQTRALHSWNITP